LEYIICGDRVRVYALEKERPGVPFKASASAFHNEAFRKGFERSSDRVSFKVRENLEEVLYLLILSLPIHLPPAD
jgi:hypothetical protein